MKVQVLDDSGAVMFESDTSSTTGVAPAAAEKAAVAAALQDAAHMLTSDQHVISSIKSDLQAVVTRVETELGAHPAFTWVQTKIGSAISDLEAYVKGVWTEAEAKVAAIETKPAAAPIAAVTGADDPPAPAPGSTLTTVEPATPAANEAAAALAAPH